MYCILIVKQASKNVTKKIVRERKHMYSAVLYLLKKTPI